ncbi:tol-pal system protein YbgF [Photobacterium aquimaris]|uniref:Cell division coordinator CpoB n=1 Tax=Photobacterium aquimaris TaxID=512643 RepID=A0A2T3ISQ3_9GAMM|nr:tol-pal system protein YbgF [Photobacterium aquimaris]OBU18604.1 tol-pal system protein YbgF [Photobacterium aquimaris]OBU21025.1 tol-pal system protein YbgF [Photobacterium aquimaris]PSU31369.1 tol-pal system protein YbgF [Photobacterium aquimaris]PSW03053.1 tol-pal system protein YbgF [Photobacterium aquimaris]
MSSNKVMRQFALVLLVGAATQVVAAPASAANLQTLERMLEAQGQSQLQVQRQLDQMSTDLDNIRGKVERNSYDIKQMKERQRQLYNDVDQLSRQPVKAAPTAKEATKAPTEAYSKNMSENDAYQNAVNLILKKKDYQGATKAFQSFLTTYPDSVYKPNASYWLGQLYFAQNDLSQAAKNFGVVASIQDSSKRADALLKLGVIAERGNDTVKAMSYYTEVVKAYPSSTSAKQAQTALANLSKH